MNLIDTLFDRLKAQKRKALIAFLGSGDPDLKATVALVCELVRRAPA